MEWRLVRIGLIATLIIGVGTSARPEITRMVLRVDGIACSFCAYGLEKKLKKIEGVKAVNIRLNQGTVTLRLNPHGHPDLKAVHKAVRDAGFTLRRITVTAVGRLAVEGDHIVLHVRGTDGRFLLHEPAASDRDLAPATRERLEELARRGAMAVVTGLVHFHADGPPGLGVIEWRVIQPSASSQGGPS